MLPRTFAHEVNVAAKVWNLPSLDNQLAYNAITRTEFYPRLSRCRAVAVIR